MVAGEAAAAAWTHPPTHPPTLLPPQNKAPVHQLGLDLWRDVVVRSPRIQKHLLSLLLDMVQVGGWVGGVGG